MTRHRIAVLAYDMLATFEFGCVVEIFGLPRPELDVEWYDFAVCSLEDGPLRSTGGVILQAPFGPEKLLEADTIIIPGWPGPQHPVPEELKKIIRQAAERGVRLASICSGIFVLAESGVLDGRRATTHWLYADIVRSRFPKILLEPDVLYVDEGRVVTSAGSAAGIDMMLHLIRSDYGSAICNMVARRMVVPPHRDGGQRQFVQRPVPVLGDTRLDRVIEYLRSNPAKDHKTVELAKLAAMSPRTFFRKFKDAVGASPYDWLIRERIEIAKQLLEESRMSIDQIAALAGFGAAETMRHHFHRALSRTPIEYRRTFGGGTAMNGGRMKPPPSRAAG